ncbi:uncharacterized protein EKO05_0005353 [Ascochyta rabiei]|uniref:uncharacterized protein n=1 Tax=Didymella rabiei TaxID=5454 RepID=UPI002200FDB6|nr:uncharacterized protein EKO05_0005353 [Ascochyta rabiei]UPX14882.1 hypothetical protein EKO05_0005353 [Ascochyta rabiei]
MRVWKVEEIPMALYFSSYILVLALAVPASASSLNTAGPSSWSHPSPSHLPWAWNQTAQTTGLVNSTYTGSPRATPTVNVGGGGELAFYPSSLNASVGSTIVFNFLALNHTLTQSNLSTPCQYNGGFDSGYRNFNPANLSGKFVIEYEVHREGPQWFFCSQSSKTSHCHAGMVFSLNPDGAHPKFFENARSTITAETQPTLACQQPASGFSQNRTVLAPTTGTISASVRSSSIALSPPISNGGDGRSITDKKFVIGVSLLAGFYVVFL